MLVNNDLTEIFQKIMCPKLKINANISTQRIKIRVSLIQETRRDETEIQKFKEIRDETR
jgi:hypothetical protein